MKIWPWSHLRALREMVQASIAAASAFKNEAVEASVAVEQAKHHIRELNDALGKARNENGRLELELAGMRARLNTQITAAAKYRAELVRLSAQVEGKARSSIVLHPPTEYKKKDEPSNHVATGDDHASLEYGEWPYGCF